MHVAAFNLGIVMRQMIGVGTPKGLAALNDLVLGLLGLVRTCAVRVADFFARIGAFAAIILSDPESRRPRLQPCEKAPSSTGC